MSKQEFSPEEYTTIGQIMGKIGARAMDQPGIKMALALTISFCGAYTPDGVASGEIVREAFKSDLATREALGLSTADFLGVDVEAVVSSATEAFDARKRQRLDGEQDSALAELLDETLDDANDDTAGGPDMSRESGPSEDENTESSEDVSTSNPRNLGFGPEEQDPPIDEPGEDTQDGPTDDGRQFS